MHSGLKKGQEASPPGAVAVKGPVEVPKPGAQPVTRDDIGELKAQLAAMQQKIEKLSQDRN